MRIVVTGALGHIGSKFIRYIPRLFPGAEICMIDNLLTQRYCSLFHLSDQSDYHLIPEDILKTDLESAIEGADVVVHLAAITDALGSIAIPDEVHRVNYLGTQAVARACVHYDCPMIFISTTSVYGPHLKMVDEMISRECLKPQSPYAESKLKTEELLNRMGDSDGLRFITFRFGTVFGASPGMRFHTAVNLFCWQAILGRPLSVWKTAMHQHRPYLDLEDAVRALNFAIQKGSYDGETYNVLTTNATVNDIVRIISSYVSEVSVRYVDAEIMNQLSYRVSNERFRDLGFEFKGDLKKGIYQTLEWLKPVCRAPRLIPTGSFE